MKVTYIKVDGTTTVEIVKKEPKYERISEFLEGYMERFQMLMDNPREGGKPLIVWVYANEEGILKGLPVNEVISQLVVRSATLMGTVARQKIRGNCIIMQRGS